MPDKIEFTPDFGAKENSSIIKVIGIGGGGSNAVEHMYSEGIVGVDFLICNTDQGHLEKSPIPNKLLLGQGLGAGAKPEVAQQYARESKDKIREFIGNNTKMLFITAGMGKGTGTGASPVVAEIAQEMGILTIAVVTSPFKFEGKKTREKAETGIEELNKHVDSMIVVQNQNLFACYNDETLSNAYNYANDVLKNAVKCIAELITKNYIQNVDFNDISSIMKNSGRAMLGIAIAKGEDRVNKVVDDALNCPLLDTSNIQNAQNFLFFVSTGPNSNFSAGELNLLTDRFEELQSDDVEVIWGQGVDETLDDAIKLSVIITNFSACAEGTQPNTIVINEGKHADSFTTTAVLGTTIEEPTIQVEHHTTAASREMEQPKMSEDQEPKQPTGPFMEPERFDSSEPIHNNSGKVFVKEPDPLFSSELDFLKNISEPAINRVNAKTAATAEQPVLSTEESYSFETPNDFKDFYMNLAD